MNGSKINDKGQTADEKRIVPECFPNIACHQRVACPGRAASGAVKIRCSVKETGREDPDRYGIERPQKADADKPEKKTDRPKDSWRNFHSERETRRTKALVIVGVAWLIVWAFTLHQSAKQSKPEEEYD